jgi:hypothetical protein
MCSSCNHPQEKEEIIFRSADEYKSSLIIQRAFFYPQQTRVRHIKKALIIMLSVILTAGFAFASWEETPESDMDMMRELKAVFGSLSDFPLATYRMSDMLFSGNEEYTIEIAIDSDGMAKNKYPRVDVDLIHVAHDDFFRYNEWLSENGQKVVDAMKNAKSTIMKFTFKKAGEITYKLDGRKFAECYEAAKTIPVV